MDNNFDENQNIKEPESTDEFSTVFSDPTAHNISAENKKGNGKKRITMIIAGVLAVAVLVGSTVAVVKLIPENDDDTSSGDTIPEISVLKLEETDVKSLTVTNENGSFVMNNTVTEDEDETEVCTWSLEGYYSDVISEYTLSSVATSVIEISALREITLKTAEQCGLTEPQVTAVIKKSDNGEETVLIGDKSPDNTGVYLKLESSDEIYLVSNGFDENLIFTELDLANTDALAIPTLDEDDYEEYLSSGVLSTFDKMTVSGNNFDKKVVIEQNTNESISDLMPFVLTSPTYRAAQNADVVLPLFSSTITVSGAYALDSKPATIKKFGLDSPDVEVSIKVKDFNYTYKFKKQSDGYYAVWHTDCKMITMVDSSINGVLSYNTTSFYSSWVHLQSIDELSGFNVKSDGKEYNFSIKVDEDDEAEEKYVIKYGDKKLTADNFQDFYRYCISLSVSEFVTEKVTGEPEYELTYVYSDGRKSTKIAFYRVSATKYQFSFDGEMVGKVNASDMNRIDDYVKKVIKDETITVL